MNSMRREMKKTQKRMTVLGFAALLALSGGCVTTDVNSPYYGQEFRQGVPALGAALAPLAKPDAPINADRGRSMQSLQGMGVLLDLLSR